MKIFVSLFLICSLAFNAYAQAGKGVIKDRKLKDVIFSKDWEIVHISEPSSHRRIVESDAEFVRVKFARPDKMYITNTCNSISYKFSTSRDKVLNFKLIERTLAGCGFDSMQREDSILAGFNQVQTYKIVYTNNVEVVLRLANGEDWTLK
ncbi:META domain-containing protein [Comamonas sp.]|uniref:META domain-containing protein n=1 Tax=Comamonas sp. TaxID=34028 RepID=UPI00289FE1A0|nr:META domain-containing protein [Comamonas sp.]